MIYRRMISVNYTDLTVAETLSRYRLGATVQIRELLILAQLFFRVSNILTVFFSFGAPSFFGLFGGGIA